MFNYGYYEVFGVYDFSSKFSGISLVLVGSLVLLCIPVFSSSRDSVGYYRLEVYALLIILVVSCVSIICSTSLLVTVLSMESIAFCSYVLVSSKLTLRGANGGWIYAVYGSLVSIFVMLGTVLILGSSGSLSYSVIGYHLLCIQESGNLHTSIELVVGLLLVVFGFMFKLSAAPYHSWSPDVYASTPIGVLTFFAVVVKVSIFISFIRFSSHCLFPVFDYMCMPMLLCMGCLSVLVGSIGGLLQSQIKRLLAYSSISHIGFVIVGLAFFKTGGLGPSVCYMLVYVLTSLGIFSIMATTYRCAYSKGPLVYISDLCVLRDHYPARAAFFVILVFSLLGLPPLAGFFAKYGILSVVVKSGGFTLALVLVISASISAFYYLRLVYLIVFAGSRESSGCSINGLFDGFRLFYGTVFSGFRYATHVAVKLRSPRSVSESDAKYNLLVAVVCAFLILLLTMIIPGPDLTYGTSPFIKKFMLEREVYMLVPQLYVATGMRISLDYIGRSLTNADKRYVFAAHRQVTGSISVFLSALIVFAVSLVGISVLLIDSSSYAVLNLYAYEVCM